MSGAGMVGILVVDKPEGPTSHDIVARARRGLGVRRVGHCGTLDPLATGVLVLCVGSATRLSQWLTGGDKEYEAVVRLGAASDTDDALGRIEPLPDAPAPTTAAVRQALAGFVGEIDQVPPDHSAVKVDGVRSYRRARRNQPTRLASRRVRIDGLDVLEYRYPRLRLLVRCGKGTYIRSLARDLGRALGTAGYVEQLRRLRVGTMTSRQAVPVEALDAQDVQGRFIDPRQALRGILAAVDLDPAQADRFRHGGAVAVEASAAAGDRAVFADQRLLGVGRIEGAGCLRPVTVLAEATPVP